MARGRGAISISVSGDYNDRDINRAIRDLERLKTQSAATTPAMGALGRGFAAAGAALVAMVGIQEITQFLKDSAKAAIEDEKSMRSLAKAMENVGLSAQLPEIEAGIDRLSRMNGIADDKLRPAFQQLALVTEDVTQSQKLLALAMDISAGTGRDLESVTMALAKAAGGQTTALGRLGVGLDSTLLKSKDMDAITAELSRKFGGQAAAAADTYGGKMARLSVAADEAKEAIGYALLDSVDRLSQAFGGTGGATALISDFGNETALTIRGVAELVAGLGLLAPKQDLTAASTQRLTDKYTSFTDAFIKSTNAATARGNYFGSAIEGLVTAVQYLGDASLEAKEQQNGYTSATVQAAIASADAAPRVRGLANALDFIDIKARTAADAFFILYGNINKFAKSGIDAGLARADRAERIAAGLAIDPAELMANSASSAGASAAAQTISKHMQQVLAQATAIVQNAGASDSMQSFNATKLIFGNIAEQYGPAKDAVSGLFDQAFLVLGEKIEAARQIGQQIADGLTGQLSLATALETAKATGGSIVDAFVEQGAKVQAFATNLQKLMNAGLSKQAFDEIVSAGYQRGADIADALLQGNVNENVRRANEVYTSVNNIAVQTGNQAAAAFGQVGIQMAIDMMQALIDALTGKKGKAYKTLQAAMDALAASLYRKTFIDIETRNIGGGGAFTPTPASVMEQQQAIALQSFNAGTGIFDPGTALEFFPVLGEGGPVTAHQPYIVGDLGPELFVPNTSGTIIPNNRMGGSSGLGGATYNITVQAGVGDPREIGRQVVEAIKSFERASGPVFVNA